MVTKRRMRPSPTWAFVPTTPLPQFGFALATQGKKICHRKHDYHRQTTPEMRLHPQVTKLLGAAAGMVLLLSHPTTTPALTEAQKLVAEAWRVVDQSFVDRTFNKHDWFSIRMKAVKKPYATVGDAYPAIRNMLALLADPYTRFLTPEQFSSLTSSATGELAGVGVEMFPSRVDDVLKVSSPVDGSPAARAGIRPLDVIQYIDGEPTDSLTPDEAAARIRGKPGTTVMLSVVHDAGKPGRKAVEETLQLTREKLRLQTVTVTSLGNDTLLAKIKQFNSSTADDLMDALHLQKGIKKIVLDLRNNPGGYFPGGVDVARLFMKAETPVVFVVDKNGIQEEMDTFQDGEFVDVPLVVLVNEKTASASEILAGALKDNGRAKLIGVKTFGKGVVQTVSQLSDGSGLAVTVARYETPGHKDINKIGIAPDIVSVCSLDADVLSCIPPSAW